MTDGSGDNDMEYEYSNADRLGEESRRAALFTFRVNFPKNPISMRRNHSLYFFEYLPEKAHVTLDKR